MTTINAVGNGLSGSSGTGSFAGSNSASFTTPNLGVASATSINFGNGALNAYESNATWNPTFTFTTPGDLSVSYATQTGYYSQIGNLVLFGFELLFTPTYTTASGAAIVGGLALPSGGSYPSTLGMVSFSPNVIISSNNVCLQVSAGDTTITFLGTTSGSAFSLLGTSSFLTATQNNIIGSGFYFV